ncbi:hypothetical protein J0X20_32940 [Streptomyces sp. KCTC 0041BP]|nr:hypothetical protein [Streptomyces sp. KCTC 0041BP]
MPGEFAAADPPDLVLVVQVVDGDALVGGDQDPSVMDVATPTTSPSTSTIRKGGFPNCTGTTVTRGEAM